jgi:hypothetical protein
VQKDRHLYGHTSLIISNKERGKGKKKMSTKLAFLNAIEFYSSKISNQIKELSEDEKNDLANYLLNPTLQSLKTFSEVIETSKFHTRYRKSIER